MHISDVSFCKAEDRFDGAMTTGRRRALKSLHVLHEKLVALVWKCATRQGLPMHAMQASRRCK